MTEVWNRINVEENPELKDRVKDGSLFVWECPHCGKTNLARYQTVYHDPEGRLMVWLLPPGSLPEESVRAVERGLEEASGTLEGYVFRRVDDVGSLIEKINIFDAGLDDTVIELCKYVTRMELAGKAGGKGVQDAPFKFFRIDGADNDIELSYPLDGKMHGARIGFNIYEDCAGIIRRNPSMRPSGGFPRIDQEWVAGYFR